MDGSTLSPYPHLSWFAYAIAVQPPRAFVLHEYKAVTHRLVVTEQGDAEFSWTAGGAHANCHVTAGSLSFYPCDSTRHALGIAATGAYRGHVLLIPRRHLESVCEAEGVGHAVEGRVLPAFRDPLVLSCALRLLEREAPGHVAEDIGSEIAARQVILRLAAMCGNAPPAWLHDTSVFPPRVMTLILERVDAHLRVHATLEDISGGFGLSPSHFARKFRQSTGVSLNRFINRRRIGLSLALLKSDKASLAQLSLDLGFSSQSHFTRLFSSLTGLTPHQFRRAQRLCGD